MLVSAERVGATSGITSKLLNDYTKVRWHVCCAFPVDVWHIRPVDGTDNVWSKCEAL